MNCMRQLRKSVGLRQVDVAKHLTIKQSAISQWETGATTPSSKMLPRIAALYNCTVDEVLEAQDMQFVPRKAYNRVRYMR